MVKNYKNNFGELNEEEITLYINGGLKTIKLKDLVRIRFVKRQRYHINYLAFILSILLLFFLINNVLSLFAQVMIVIITIALLLVSFFYRTYCYRFVLIKKNFFTEIIVAENRSKDAENLAYEINKMILF